MVQGLAILSSIRIARALEPLIYGIYSLIFINVGIFLMFSGLGLRLVLIRKISRNSNDAKSVLFYATFIRTLVTIIVVILYYLYNKFISPISESPIVYLMMFYIIASVAWDVIESIAFGHEKMGYSGVLNIIFTAIWVISIYTIPVNYINIYNLILIQVILAGIKSLTYFIISYSQKYFSGALVLNNFYNVCIDIIKQSLPFYFLSIMTLLSTQVPVLFLNYQSNTEEIAFYNIGFKLLSPMQLLLSFALTALFPNLSKLYLDDINRFQRVTKKALIVMSFGGIIIAFIFSIFRWEIVSILYGNQYIRSSDVIGYQCWYTVLFSMFCLIGTVLGSLDKQNLLAVLSLIYNIVSIPILWYSAAYGAVGLSIGYLVAAILNMTYHWIVFQKGLPRSFSLRFSFFLFSTLATSIVLSILFIKQVTPIETRIIVLVLLGTLIAFMLFRYREKLKLYFI